MIGQIRAVDRAKGGIVMEERNLDVFATDPRQLDGLAEGQNGRLWFQQRDGRQLIHRIVPVPKETRPNCAVVHFYNQRGTPEQRIKEGKAVTHWTRLSCHRFRANEVCLLLGGIAYNLGNLLRRLVLPLAILSGR